MSVRRRLGAVVVGVVVGLAGAAVAAGPAQAAPAEMWGFAYMDNPTPPPGWVMDPSRQWGSWKVAFPADMATVSQLGPGAYRVRFPHLATDAGVAHVTAVVGQVPAWCKLDRWFVRRHLFVDVSCHKLGGAPYDTPFSIVFSQKSAPLAVPGGAYAYVHADAGAGLIDSYNSAGATNAAAAGGGGFYRVVLPKVGTSPGFSGNVQVSAVFETARRCTVADIAVGGDDVYVYVTCVDGAGMPADSGFTLTYHRERPVFGEVAPPRRFGYVLTGPVVGPGTDFNSAGGVNAVVPSGPGQTFVRFPFLGVKETHAQVTAFATGPNFCVLQDVWQTSGGDAFVRNVICFDGTGAQADHRSFVTFSSRI